jgi:uncharacterized membrane protein
MSASLRPFRPSPEEVPTIRGLVQGIVGFFPPTIHPMILHFPIALLYLTAVVDVLAQVLPDRDRFLQRAGFWCLTLTAFFTVLTIAAGAISQQSVHFTPLTRRIFHRHQLFAGLTGGAVGVAWLLRVFTPFRTGQGWTLFGRGRGTLLSTAVVVLAAVCITVTAMLGGQLVYDHGAGVLGVTRGA